MSTKTAKFNTFIKQVESWSASDASILGVLLVGSHARGTATEDSDIDLVIICEIPQKYCANSGWITKIFGEAKIGNLEDWGLVKSWRAHFRNELEAEFGLTSTKWCSETEIALGTGKVVSDGALIVFERNRLLTELVDAVKAWKNPSSRV